MMKQHKKVAEEGYALAKAMNAQAILLHVLHERPNYYIDSPSVYEMHIGYIEDLKIAIQKFLDNTKKHLGDKHILTVLKEGDIAETILETARDLGVDIIVMGTHSRRWLENIIMGK